MNKEERRKNLKKKEKNGNIDNIEVDRGGVLKQNKDEMIKNGKYTRVEVVVGEENTVPYIQFEAHNVSRMTVLCTILSLEKMLEQLKSDYPEYKLVRRFMHTQDFGEIRGGFDDDNMD